MAKTIKAWKIKPKAKARLILVGLGQFTFNNFRSPKPKGKVKRMIKANTRRALIDEIA